jgi:uncharacterized SAM-binding protein YcdF (DUF218 family)
LKRPAQTRNAFLSDALPRGVALFLGTFCLLNWFMRLQSAGADGNLWWIDLRFLPASLTQPFLFAAATLMLWFGLRPAGSVWRRWLTIGSVGLLALVTLENAVQFYLLLARGTIHAGIPIALSLLVAAALTWLAFAIWRQRFQSQQQPLRAVLQMAGVSLACALAFPVLQMVCFGKTDYRRPADAAVVLGARAYADGRPSDALADRVRTACALYRDDLVRKLIFSGGPGDGAITESQAMKRMALRLGVKAEDIVLDETGVNTRATVRNTEALLHQLNASRVLVVSHFYHLPRVKLAYHQAGTEVYTVPAKESYLLRQLPYNMAREVAAFWMYYLRLKA